MGPSGGLLGSATCVNVEVVSASLVRLAAVVLVVACGPGESSQSLHGRTFLSTAVAVDGSPRTLHGVQRLRLSFLDEGQVAAHAGCNHFGGSYEIMDGILMVDDASTTIVGCSVDLHVQDSWYFGVLGADPTIAIDGGTVVLDGDGTQIEYLDEEVALPDLALVGPRWTVEAIIEGEVVTAGPWSRPPSMVFEEGGVRLWTGCNGGTAGHALAGDRITFSHLELTLRSCSDPSVQQLESAVVGVLEDTQPVTWEITGSRLRLRGAEAGLELRGVAGE